MTYWACLFTFGGLLAAAPLKLSVVPQNPLLFGKGTRQPLLVVAHHSDGSTEDVTARASFRSEKPAIVAVETGGNLRAEANGGAVIRVAYQGLEAFTTALVQRAGASLPPSFTADILPVLTKIGCNGGSCHGALNGQNGFKLSLFGYEPGPDYEMIASKRLNLGDPAKSLLLQKPTFQVAHGGGQVLRLGSPEYNTLLDWIRSGAKRSGNDERRMTALRVTPAVPVLYGKDAKARLLVTAHYSDGTEGDVTSLVKF